MIGRRLALALALLRAAPAAAQQVALEPFALHTVANSAYARVGVDGPLHPGKGVGLSLEGGVGARWGLLELQLRPMLALERRVAFATVGQGDPGTPLPNASYAGRIDWPEAWGWGSDATVFPGDSYVALRPVEGAAIALSTERLRWGPAERNALVLSGNGPGFPHVSVGTTRPIDVGFGTVALEVLVGTLSESPSFDTVRANDRRRMVGIAGAFAPDFVSGLELGVIGVEHEFDTTSTSGLERIIHLPFAFFSGSGVNNLRGNGLASLYLRWLFPENGLEVYGELARDDHAEDLTDLMGDPDHSLATVFGLRKELGGSAADGTGSVRATIGAELTELRSPTTLTTYRSDLETRIYTHTPVIQGHTHRGYLLGAPIGPGSRSLLAYLAVPRPAGGGSLITLERIEYDGAAFAARHAPTRGARGRDVEWTVGLGQFRTIGSLVVDGSLELSRRANRTFLGFDGARASADGSYPIEHNVRLDLWLVWTPGGPGPEALARLAPRTLGRR